MVAAEVAGTWGVEEAWREAEALAACPAAVAAATEAEPRVAAPAEVGWEVAGTVAMMEAAAAAEVLGAAQVAVAVDLSAGASTHNRRRRRRCRGPTSDL